MQDFTVRILDSHGEKYVDLHTQQFSFTALGVQQLIQRLERKRIQITQLKTISVDEANHLLVVLQACSIQSLYNEIFFMDAHNYLIVYCRSTSAFDGDAQTMALNKAEQLFGFFRQDPEEF
ncbi:MAG: hypothetical protein ACOYOK_16085 [Pseudobdellovibrionaceae bacterium]